MNGYINNHLDRVCQNCKNVMRDGSLREVTIDEARRTRTLVVHDHYDVFEPGCPNICEKAVGKYSVAKDVFERYPEFWAQSPLTKYLKS